VEAPPEASVFTPILLGIVAIVFATIYRENRYEACGLNSLELKHQALTERRDEA